MTNGPRSVESPPSFPALVQEYFTHYIVDQRALSPRTVAAYRDTFILFLLISKILQLGEANMPDEARWWPQRRVDATEASQDGNAG